VKKLAIRQLEECHLSVVSRLTVYQLYKVDLVYILPLIYELCTRDEGPTDEETEEMGVKTSLIIFRIRERLRAGVDGAKSPIAAGTDEEDIIQTIYAVLGVDTTRAIRGGMPLIGSVFAFLYNPHQGSTQVLFFFFIVSSISGSPTSPNQGSGTSGAIISSNSHKNRGGN